MRPKETGSSNKDKEQFTTKITKFTKKTVVPQETKF